MERSAILLVVVIAFFGGAVSPVTGAEILINFDSLQGMINHPGTPVPEVSQLSDEFLTTHGVSFESESGYVAVVVHGALNISHPNVIGGVKSDGTLSYGTPIIISFFDPLNPTVKAVTNFVSIRGDPVSISGATATMEVFGVTDNFLESVTKPDILSGLTLEIIKPGIHSVLLTQNSSGGGPFDGTIGLDNVRFEEVVAVGPTCSDPDPHTQGYWHRQCMGAGLITPGRNGRGPQTILEPDFLKDLVPAVNLQLQASIFMPPTFLTCEDGMDAAPPSDPCERALKQYTALLLNIASSRLEDSCNIDLSGQGCSAATIADLMDELAALINTGDQDNCRLAADCAGAVNENQGIVVAAAAPVGPDGGPSLFGVGLDIAPAAGTTAGSPQQAPVVGASPATPGSGSVSAVANPEVLTADAPTAVDSSAPALVPYISNVGSPVASQIAAEESTVEMPGTSARLERHLAVIANASAPARARRISEDALLTALGGGYEPEVRLEIVRGLLGNVDVAYNSLLIKHLEDIRSEAMEFDNEKAVQEAARLLKNLELSRESEE